MTTRKDSKVKRLTAAPEQPPVPLAGAEAKISSTTIGDYGHRLPVGILQGGALHRGFAFKPFRMKEERELEAKRKANKRISVGDFVTAVMAHMLTKLGPHSDFQSLTEDQRQLVVSQMYLGDVVYMWLCLRIEALGEAIQFPLKCGSCGFEQKLKADLNLTDVKVYEDLTSLTKNVKLRHGMVLPDGDETKDVVIQPPRWSGMCGASPGANASDVKMALLIASIHTVGDGKFSATTDAIEALSKWDVELMSKAVDTDSPGPDMTLEAVCSRCSNEWKIPLEWNWDFFFTAASL